MDALSGIDTDAALTRHKAALIALGVKLGFKNNTILIIGHKGGFGDEFARATLPIVDILIHVDIRCQRPNKHGGAWKSKLHNRQWK